MRIRNVAMILISSVCLITLTACAGHHKNNVDMKALTQAVDVRSDEESARDKFRHPAETMAFFKVSPGMTVAEALPGTGWYSKILANYLGENGALYGINYADDMWARFGFFSEERIKQLQARTQEFPGKVAEFTDNGIKAESFTFANMPDSLAGSVDRVLFIRALHNLNRFEEEAGTLEQAMQVTNKLLKPDGMVGVVQHRLPESASEAGAKGQRGYLKQSSVIKMFEQAGFELVSKSDINANPKDIPAESDIVWRLPPNFIGTGDNEQKRAEMEAIGESDRMTLLFKKR